MIPLFGPTTGLEKLVVLYLEYQLYSEIKIEAIPNNIVEATVFILNWLFFSVDGLFIIDNVAVQVLPMGQVQNCQVERVTALWVTLIVRFSRQIMTLPVIIAADYMD